MKAQYDLYGPTGDKVVDSFVELSKKGLSAADIKEGMRKKIEELGPANVSRHCADPKKLNVFDVDAELDRRREGARGVRRGRTRPR